MKKRTHYVVIPVVNCWEHTKQCIESIKSKEDFKIIIVDNGSSDATTTEAEKIDRVIYLRNDENVGVSAAWNQGIAHALEDDRCGYIYVLNNDIKLRHDAFDNLIVYADQAHLGESDYMLVSSMPFIGPEEELDEAAVSFTEGDGGCYSAFMIAPGTIDKVGWFDEGFYPAYFEDNDYDYRIKALNLLSKKSTGSVFFNYQSQTTAQNDHVRRLVNQNFGKCRAYYMDKWGGPPHHEAYQYPFDKAMNDLKCTKQGEPTCEQPTKY